MRFSIKAIMCVIYEFLNLKLYSIAKFIIAEVFFFFYRGSLSKLNWIVNRFDSMNFSRDKTIINYYMSSLKIIIYRDDMRHTKWNNLIPTKFSRKKIIFFPKFMEWYYAKIFFFFSWWENWEKATIHVKDTWVSPTKKKMLLIFSSIYNKLTLLWNIDWSMRCE